MVLKRKNHFESFSTKSTVSTITKKRFKKYSKTLNQKSEIEEVKLKKWYFGKVILENSRNKRRKNQRKFMLAIYVSFYFTGPCTLHLRIETIRMLDELICNVTKFRWLVFP